MRGWLIRHGWLIAIAVAYLYVFPYFPKIHSANELPRVYLVKAMAEDGTFAIDRGVARWGATADVSPWGGHQYSNKAPGSSMLVVPVYAAVRAVSGGEPGLGATMWLCRVIAGVIPMLLFLALLDRFLVRWAAEAAVRRLVLVGYALGSMAMTYSMLYISHQLAAVCVGAAWILALEYAEEKRGVWAMAAAGLLAGASVLVEYQAAFALPVVAAHVLWKLRGRPRPRREIARAMAAAAVAAVIPIAVLLAYHDACFGHPLRTGYDASQTFAEYHQQGFLGITALRWEALRGSTIAPDNGLFALSPWWLLAIPGAIVLWRRRARGGKPGHEGEPAREREREPGHEGEPARERGGEPGHERGGERGGERDIVLAGGSIAIMYLLFISSINFWRGGWSVGPRYITVMLPFLLPLVTAAVAAAAGAGARTSWRQTLRLGVATGAIAAGVVIYVAAAATFPHWPDRYRAPLYEVTFRLLADGLAAPSLGSWLGLGAAAAVAPYFALAGGLLGWAVVRAGGWRVLAIAAGVAAAVIGAHGLAPRTGAGGDAAYQRVVRPAVEDATGSATPAPAKAPSK